MKWEDLREEEFEDAVKVSGKVCVVPIGCVEKHGQHLPVGTDVHIAAAIAEMAAEIEPVVVFPPVYFGDVMGHTVWRGGITLSAELLLRLLTEICREIARNGFKKIIFLNGHGGNKPLLSFLCRSFQYKAEDFVVCYRDTSAYQALHMAQDIENGVEFPELTEEDKAYIVDFVREGKIKGHACINETSLEIAIRPEYVRMDRAEAESGLPTHRTDYLKDTGVLASTRFWGIEYPNSYQGHTPVGANERIGKVMLRKRAEQMAEACRLLKMDERVLEWNDEWNDRSEWCKPKI